MQRNTNTRRVDGVRHENYQNPNAMPFLRAASLPQPVRAAAYTGEVRHIVIRPQMISQGKRTRAAVVEVAPVPLPGNRTKRYE